MTLDAAAAATILLRRRRMRDSLAGFAQSIQIPDAPVGGDDSELFAPGLSPAGGVGMFTVALSPTGAEPATHYVSTGYIAPQFLPLLTDADALYAVCQQAGLAVTHDDCVALVTGCDVSAEEPFARFAELGLALVQVE